MLVSQFARQRAGAVGGSVVRHNHTPLELGVLIEEREGTFDAFAQHLDFVVAGDDDVDAGDGRAVCRHEALLWGETSQGGNPLGWGRGKTKAALASGSNNPAGLRQAECLAAREARRRFWRSALRLWMAPLRAARSR